MERGNCTSGPQAAQAVPPLHGYNLNLKKMAQLSDILTQEKRRTA